MRRGNGKVNPANNLKPAHGNTLTHASTGSIAQRDEDLNILQSQTLALLLEFQSTDCPPMFDVRPEVQTERELGLVLTAEAPL